MGEERKPPPPPREAPYAAGRIGRREGEIVKELPNLLGVQLWQDARHVRTWLSEPGLRATIFRIDAPLWVHAARREARTEFPALSQPLSEFGRMLAKPVDQDPVLLAAACERVARWALDGAALQTAIEFAELAAGIIPNDPKLVNLAGRATRNANEYDRSEIWFQRAICIAREQENDVELARAHLGYGRLCMETRQDALAVKHIGSGANIARRNGNRPLAAEAQHDLCAYHIGTGDFSEAEKRAERALAIYGKSHHRLPFFGADVALLCVFEGDFGSAARLLKTVLRLIRQPQPRTVLYALLARALEGAGQAHDAETSRRRAVKLLENKHGGPLEPLARWHLADSERLAGRWEAAHAEAERALAVAQAVDDRETEHHVRLLLAQIRANRPGPRRPSRSESFTTVVTELRTRLIDWSARRARVRRSPWGNDWAA